MYTIFVFFCHFGFLNKHLLYDVIKLDVTGCNKRTMPLIASKYPLANVILEATIKRRFVKFCGIGVLITSLFRFLDAVSSINSSICGAAIDSILMYFCIVYK